MRPDQTATPDALPHWDAFFLERAEVRPSWSLDQSNRDRNDRGGYTPRGKLHASAAGAALRSEAAGLVSVPTSLDAPAFGLSAAQSGAEVKARRKVAVENLGAFTLDAPARRLSQLRMSVGFAARAHAVSAKGHRSDVPWMVTLTYKPGVEWQADHLSKAMQKCRNWCDKKGIAFRYVWIAEIQDGKRRHDGKGRDVIHYHAVIWLPVGVGCPHFDKRRWWPHGMTQSKPPEHVKNAVGYLLHYLKKDKNLEAMPKGARAYGVGGLDHSLRRARRWLGLPRFVQGNSDIGDNWRRAPGGGWLSPAGTRFHSEFASIVVGGVRSLVRVCTYPVSIEAAGPFSWLARSVGGHGSSVLAMCDRDGVLPDSNKGACDGLPVRAQGVMQ